MQAAFYATPILYPLTRVPHQFAKYLILNPMAQIIQDSRYVLVTKQTQTIYQVFGGDKWIWLIPTSLTIMIAILASTYFRKRSKFFAEEV